MPQSIVVWKVFPTKATNIDHPKDFSLGQVLSHRGSHEAHKSHKSHK